jgi:LemA protein
MRSKGALGLIVIILLIAFAGCSGCNTYNRLVGLDEEVSTAWGQVENQYQRRADLIPNLVNTVKNAVAIEQETINALTEASNRVATLRSSTGLPSDLAGYLRAQSNVSAALQNLMSATGGNPQLQSVEAYRDLLVQLEGAENRISVERKRYNDAVASYNRSVRRFPASIWAGLFGFNARPAFEAEEGAAQSPEINL